MAKFKVRDGPRPIRTRASNGPKADLMWIHADHNNTNKARTIFDIFESDLLQRRASDIQKVTSSNMD
jgi:hypothetical protein